MAPAVCPQCSQLRQRVAELEARVAALTQQLQEAQRAGKRQAAPFSKGPPKPNPQKPGRKPGPGYGKKGHRQPPAPEQIDETLEAPLPQACPQCGGTLQETGVQAQFQVEIPRKPIHRQFNVHIGCCQECGRRVQGRHPLQTSDALGAAAAQVGPEAQAAIVTLNKESGLSHGKIIGCLNTLFGIRLTRGASVQTVLRAAERCQSAYQEIEQAIADADRLAVDETGWRQGGLPAWLHAWVSPRATCYAIAPSRSADALEEVIGPDYAGYLIHDGWSSYDRFEKATHQQCVWHALRRAHNLLAKAKAGAARFPRQVVTLLDEALHVRDCFVAGKLSRRAVCQAHLELTERLERLVQPIKVHADNERFAKHLANHIDDWFTFLLFPEAGLDATNFRAEQALRPAVVNRKVWGGNRTPAGGRAQSVLSSVIVTCKQQARSALDFIGAALRGLSGPLLNPVVLQATR
jgi:transposase